MVIWSYLQISWCVVRQVGFFELVVIPLYEGLTYAFEDLVLMLDAAKNNHRFWVEGNPEATAHHVTQFRAAIPPSYHENSA